MKWVNSGGPILVIPAELAPEWRGVEPPPDAFVPEGWSWGLPGGPVCDYDRACRVRGLIGTIRVGRGRGLVLGDEPLATACLETSAGFLLIRWMCAEDEESVLSVPDLVHESMWRPARSRFRVGTKGILLINSADRGDNLSECFVSDRDVSWLAVAIPPGSYRIESVDCEPDPETRVILHRLSRE
jgi:hypothetical protein